MKILLLNTNPIVSRLIKLSADKLSYEFEEKEKYYESLGHFDVIVLDDDVQEDVDLLKSNCDKFIYLSSKDKEVDFQAEILKKPFLPTDFVSLLEEKEDNLIDDNPYKDLKLDLDDLNLDDEEMKHEESIETEAEDMQDLSLDDEEFKDIKEFNGNDVDEFNESELDDALSMDFSKDNKDEKTKSLDGENIVTNENVEIDNKEDKQEIQEDGLESIDEEDKSNINDSISQDEENVVNEEKIEDIQDEDLLEDMSIKEQNNDEKLNQDDDLEELPEIEDKIIPEVEETEKEISFDDIPENADFIGQDKENLEITADVAPVVLDDENLSENLNENLSVQDQIKAELDELDSINENLSQENELEIEDKTIPEVEENETKKEEEQIKEDKKTENKNDFDDLSEDDIKLALGETSSAEDNVKLDIIAEDNLDKENKGSEIVEELSKSIADTINSSIKDDTLKAALKGMSMNININISFKDE